MGSLFRRSKMDKKSIQNISLDTWKNQRVFVRVDFNVPMEGDQIRDDTRIQAALPTLKALRDAGVMLVVASHMGRPKGQVKPELSLKPVSQRLEELLGSKVVMAPDCIGPETTQIVSQLSQGEVCLLENLRFHAEEEKNDPSFGKSLSELADIYVNDAFGSAHRAHASTEGITRHLPAYAGLLMEKELNFLGGALANPKRPLVAIVGGAKVGSKIGVLQKMSEIVGSDGALLIGGGMAYTFFKAKGWEVGNSLLDQDHLPTAEEFLKKVEKTGVTVLLPEDNVIADRFDNEAQTQMVSSHEIPQGWEGVDIGVKTRETFSKIISQAGTVVWNGPMGVFEMPNFAAGTLAVAQALAKSQAITIIGGGDSVAAVKQAGVSDQMSHISTGGGASLEFLEGRQLPGVEALLDL